MMDEDEILSIGQKLFTKIANILKKEKIPEEVAITCFLNLLAIMAVQEGEDGKDLLKEMAKGLGECYRSHIENKIK